MDTPLTTEVGHTPGPWELSYEDGKHTVRMGSAIESPWDHFSEEVIEYDHSIDEDCEQFRTAEANARLIVAAPDMLEALLALNAGARPSNSSDDDLDEGERDAWRQLDAAIAKATGK